MIIYGSLLLLFCNKQLDKKKLQKQIFTGTLNFLTPSCYILPMSLFMFHLPGPAPLCNPPMSTNRLSITCCEKSSLTTFPAFQESIWTLVLDFCTSHSATYHSQD